MGMNQNIPIDVDLVSPNPLEGTGARAPFGNPSRGEGDDIATRAQALPTNDSQTDSPVVELVCLYDFVLEPRS